jgi:hypothetical protein
MLSKHDFQSVEDLVRQILAFIDEYNKAAAPFAWTYKGEPLKIN